jgi:hypothetical protein
MPARPGAGHPLKDPTQGRRRPLNATCAPNTHALIAAYRATHGGSQGAAIDALAAEGAKVLGIDAQTPAR